MLLPAAASASSVSVVLESSIAAWVRRPAGTPWLLGEDGMHDGIGHPRLHLVEVESVAIHQQQPQSRVGEHRQCPGCVADVQAGPQLLQFRESTDQVTTYLATPSPPEGSPPISFVGGLNALSPGQSAWIESGGA